MRSMAGLFAMFALCSLAAQGCFDSDGASPGDGEPRDGEQGGEQGAAGASSPPSMPTPGGDAAQMQAAACDAIGGRYQPLYTPIEGNCGALDGQSAVDLDAVGTATNVERRIDGQVTTTVVIDACHVGLEQSVATPEGEVVLHIEGELVAQADGTITGRVTASRFAGGQATCTQSYELTLRPATTIGGAAGGDASGGEMPGAGEPDEPSFSEQYAAEIERDCSQTVDCLAQQGGALPPDALAQCVEDTSRALEGDPSRQATFLENTVRCAEFLGCDYYNCALAGPGP